MYEMNLSVQTCASLTGLSNLCDCLSSLLYSQWLPVVEGVPPSVTVPKGSMSVSTWIQADWKVEPLFHGKTGGGRFCLLHLRCALCGQPVKNSFCVIVLRGLAYKPDWPPEPSDEWHSLGSNCTNQGTRPVHEQVPFWEINQRPGVRQRESAKMASPIFWVL